MNRRTKIIVSVAGVFVILLALLGITYGYFLTRVIGNTNDKSISVTTANLRLVYEDGSPNVIEEDLSPSNTIYEKTFTVTNEGTANITYGVFMIDVINTFERKNDVKYTMECSTDGTLNCGTVTTETTFPNGISELVTATIEPTKTHTYTFKFTYKDSGTDQSVDMGKKLQGKIQIYASNNNGIIIPYESNTLAFNILNNGSDVTIKTQTGEFVEDPICGYGQECLDNIATGCPGTCYAPETVQTIIETKNTKYIKDNPDFDSFANGTSWDETLQDYTNDGIFTAEDDYGTSYYYRGPITNNYLTIGTTCWRIVRIEGDGSVKLILEDQDESCSEEMNGNWDIPTTTGGTQKTGNFGYTLTANNDAIINYLNKDGFATNYENSMATAFKNYQTGPMSSYISDLKPGNWCLNDKAYANSSVDLTTEAPLTETEKINMQNNGISFYYDSYVRLSGNSIKTLTLKCNGTVMDKFDSNTNMYVGTLTADEILYAGASKAYPPNLNYYLINDYQIYNQKNFWSLSPGVYMRIMYTSAFSLGSTAPLFDYDISSNFGLRPSVSLRSGIELLSGNGTIGNPYVIE